MSIYKLLAPFRVSDTEVAQPGEFLDLADDVARMHADKLQRQPDAEVVNHQAEAQSPTVDTPSAA